MPIHYVTGNIFDAKTQVIVNPVNCRGVMGAGLALAFKEKYPAMFLTYQQQCKNGLLCIGKPLFYHQSKPWILNFPTKDHWRDPSQLAYIEQGLKHFVEQYQQEGITSIAFPKLGAGHGKLAWENVRPLMEQYLSKLPIDVTIYE